MPRTILISILLICASASAIADAKPIEFPEHQCAIDLPTSSEWRRVPAQLIADPEIIYVGLSSDGKISGTISVQDSTPKSDQDRELFIVGRKQGMERAGLTVTNITPKAFRTFPGFLMTSRGKLNGNQTVQTSWIIFAFGRAYTVTGNLIGSDVGENEARRAADFVAGFELRNARQHEHRYDQL